MEAASTRRSGELGPVPARRGTDIAADSRRRIAVRAPLRHVQDLEVQDPLEEIDRPAGSRVMETQIEDIVTREQGRLELDGDACFARIELEQRLLLVGAERGRNAHAVRTGDPDLENGVQDSPLHLDPDLDDEWLVEEDLRHRFARAVHEVDVSHKGIAGSDARS